MLPVGLDSGCPQRDNCPACCVWGDLYHPCPHSNTLDGALTRCHDQPLSAGSPTPGRGAKRRQAPAILPSSTGPPATQIRSEPSHSALRGDCLGRGSRALVEALEGGAPDSDRIGRRGGISVRGPGTGGLRQRSAGHPSLARVACTRRANSASPTRSVCDSGAYPAEDPVVGSRNPAPPTHLGNHLRGHPGASNQGGHGRPGPRGRGLRETLFVLSRCHRRWRIGPPTIRRRGTRHLPPHRGPRHVGRERG